MENNCNNKIILALKNKWIDYENDNDNNNITVRKHCHTSIFCQNDNSKEENNYQLKYLVNIINFVNNNINSQDKNVFHHLKKDPKEIMKTLNSSVLKNNLWLFAKDIFDSLSFPSFIKYQFHILYGKSEEYLICIKLLELHVLCKI